MMAGKGKLTVDITYMMEAVEELNFLCRDLRCVPDHLKRRLEKMDEEKTSAKSVKTSEGCSLEPSEEFQSLLAALRANVR